MQEQNYWGKIIVFLKSQPPSVKITFLTVIASLVIGIYVYQSNSDEPVKEKIAELPSVKLVKKPEFVRGVHLTAWVAGSKKARERIWDILNETELNTVVIAIKEYEGDVYIPGVPLAEKYKLFVNAIPDIKEYLADLKKKGIYTIARIVVFKDNNLPRKKPEWAVKRADGSIWLDRRKNAWVDPYNKEVWEYNFSISSQAIALGFDEIQFDYIRFPSDGDTKQCRYSYSQHNSSFSARAIAQFLQEASKKLKPLGCNISIDIFGLTPSVEHDMGIGQKITPMTEWMDYVSPMVYPSHYAKGEYGIPDPNREPYRVVHKTISDAKKRLGEKYVRLRPYLQDFSLGYKYGPKEVRAQIMACEDLGIKEWLLWNPNCHYTKAALKSKKGALDAVAQVPQSMTGKLEKIENQPSNSKKESESKEEQKKIIPPTYSSGSATDIQKEGEIVSPNSVPSPSHSEPRGEKMPLEKKDKE